SSTSVEQFYYDVYVAGGDPLDFTAPVQPPRKVIDRIDGRVVGIWFQRLETSINIFGTGSWAKTAREGTFVTISDQDAADFGWDNAGSESIDNSTFSTYYGTNHDFGRTVSSALGKIATTRHFGTGNFYTDTSTVYGPGGEPLSNAVKSDTPFGTAFSGVTKENYYSSAWHTNT